jgi:hypothetical protein
VHPYAAQRRYVEDARRNACRPEPAHEEVWLRLSNASEERGARYVGSIQDGSWREALPEATRTHGAGARERREHDLGSVGIEEKSGQGKAEVRDAQTAYFSFSTGGGG